MASPVRTPASRRPASAPQAQIAKRGASADSSAIPVVLAPLERRVAGAAIDLALLLLASGIVAAMLERATSGVTRVRIDAVSGQRTVDAATSLPTWLPLALLVAITAAYTITLMSLWGRTLGGWAVGIRCIRADSVALPTRVAITCIAGAASNAPSGNTTKKFGRTWRHSTSRNDPTTASTT